MEKKGIAVNWIIAIISILIIIGISIFFIINFMPKEYDKYLNEIILDDISMRGKAIEIVGNCSSGNKECQINDVYNHVVKNYDYYNDPREREFIQAPYETIDIGGGDCEDLTILLNSLLENIGVTTYLVLSEDHAYSLACGIDMDKLQEEILLSLNTQTNLHKEKISLNSFSAKYYGTENLLNNSLEIIYDITSDNPLDLYFVSSEDALNRWSKREDFAHYPDCKRNKVYEASGSCQIGAKGGILIVNNNGDSTVIDMEISMKTILHDVVSFSTKYYTLNDESCVILDPTLGEYGYPGYDNEIKGEKIAIDPIYRKSYSLD